MIQRCYLEAALGALASYLEERHNGRMARIVGGASRVAGSIAETLSNLAPGSDVNAVRGALIAKGVQDMRAEFAGSAKVVGATDDKLAGIIAGELGKLPRLTAIAAAVAPAADIAIDAAPAA